MFLSYVEIQCRVRLEAFFILFRTKFTRQEDDSHLLCMLYRHSLPLEVGLLLDRLALVIILLILTILTHFSKTI